MNIVDLTSAILRPSFLLPPSVGGSFPSSNLVNLVHFSWYKLIHAFSELPVRSVFKLIQIKQKVKKNIRFMPLLLSPLPSFLRPSLTSLAFSAIKKTKQYVSKRTQWVHKCGILLVRCNHTARNCTILGTYLCMKQAILPITINMLVRSNLFELTCTVSAFCLDTRKRERSWRQPVYRRPSLHHACHRKYESVLRLISLVSSDLSVCGGGSKV